MLLHLPHSDYAENPNWVEHFPFYPEKDCTCIPKEELKELKEHTTLLKPTEKKKKKPHKQTKNGGKNSQQDTAIQTMKGGEKMIYREITSSGEQIFHFYEGEDVYGYFHKIKQ